MDRRFLNCRNMLIAAIIVFLSGCKNTSPGTVEFSISKGMVEAGESTELSWIISNNFDVVSLHVTELKDGGRDWSVTKAQHNAGTLSISPSSTTEYALVLTHATTASDGTASEAIIQKTTTAVVLTAAEMQSLEEAKEHWTEMRASADGGDTSGVLSGFHPSVRDKYSTLSESLQSEFEHIFSTLENFSPLVVTEKEMQFAVTRKVDGENVASIITFKKGYDGQWYVVSM